MNSLETEAPVWDLIVVGAGAAGLSAALAAVETDPALRVLVLTKTPALKSGSTPWAQGGVAFPVDEADLDAHRVDTLAAGAGACDPAAVEALLQGARPVQAWLESRGLVWDRSPAGGWARSREGGHSRSRVLHLGGDATGAGLQAFLAGLAAADPQITLQAERPVLELLGRPRVGGVRVWNPERGQPEILLSRRGVLLATGGYGALFDHSSNPPENCGEGLLLARRAGARLADLEFVQFHPTGLFRPEAPFQPLLTEALRGAGAVLTTETGEPLAIDHPLGSLGTRDLVARAVFRHRRQGGQVFLDARQSPGTEGQGRFPTVWALCAEAGLDPGRDPLPVTPVVHYCMGGVAVDSLGRTGVPGLWAAGELTRTGVHGANRLASNSLLECLVWGRAAGRDAAQSEAAPVPEGASPPEAQPAERPPLWLPGPGAAAWERRHRGLLGEAAGPIRSAAGLNAALGAWTLPPLVPWNGPAPGAAAKARPSEPTELGNLRAGLSSAAGFDNSAEAVRRGLALQALGELGPAILLAALRRRPSVGAHFREDTAHA